MTPRVTSLCSSLRSTADGWSPQKRRSKGHKEATRSWLALLKSCMSVNAGKSSQLGRGLLESKLVPVAAT